MLGVFMDYFLINGGKKISGSVMVNSAKNALLPILAGCLLSSGEIALHNVTYFQDVNSMLEILQHLGVKITRQDSTLVLDCSKIDKYIIPLELTSKLRASIFCLGPLIGRLKKARVAYPGGCLIGSRSIDLHLTNLAKLGVEIIDKHGYVTAIKKENKSGKICLAFPSVGATENLIMASVLNAGKTEILGCAKEPEIVDLCNFLNSLGAKIFGAGSDNIIIEGVEKLFGGEYTPIPDRIITGTYVMLPLMCGGEIEISNAKPKHITSLLEILKNSSCNIKIKGDRIKVMAKGRLKSFGKVETLPYPHFPTDLQQPLSSLACIAKGTTIITENLFESRFKHVPELVKMGAKINICDSSMVIQGVKELYGAEVTATDLRGGIALVLAGLKASGYTTVKNIDLIDRGYYKLEDTLCTLGADVTRYKE